MGGSCLEGQQKPRAGPKRQLSLAIPPPPQGSSPYFPACGACTAAAHGSSANGDLRLERSLSLGWSKTAPIFTEGKGKGRFFSTGASLRHTPCRPSPPIHGRETSPLLGISQGEAACVEPQSGVRHTWGEWDGQQNGRSIMES